MRGHLSHSPSEERFLASLRERYEANGFTFLARPEKRQLPDFLGSYTPDAIARKPGRNVAIAVKSAAAGAAKPALSRIRQLFEGRDDWQFHVAVMGEDTGSSVPMTELDSATADGHIREIEALRQGGHDRAAFILAWSLLEAAFISWTRDEKARPRPAGTLVQAIAMAGLVEPEMEEHLHALADQRNRIVHGDIGAEPAPEDTATVIAAVRAVLDTPREAQ